MNKGKAKSKRRTKSRRKRNSINPRRIPDSPKASGSEPEPPVIDPDASDSHIVHLQVNAFKRRGMKSLKLPKTDQPKANVADPKEALESEEVESEGLEETDQPKVNVADPKEALESEKEESEGLEEKDQPKANVAYPKEALESEKEESEVLEETDQPKANVADPKEALEPEESEEESEGLEEEAESEQETIKPKIYLGPPEGFDSYPETKYGKRSCQRCQKLREREFKPKDDDCNYLYDKDDFEGDEELKLRVIHHRKKKWITGGFYADCQPAFTRFGGIYHQEHHWEVLNLDDMIQSSVRFVIKQYEKLKGRGLRLENILNTTMERYACWWFYVTFTGCEQSSDDVQIYHTLVAYFFRGGKHEVAILRRKVIGKDEYEDLLPPSDELTEERTRVKKELMSTLDEEDREVFELEKKARGGEVNALLKRERESKATVLAPLSLD